MADPLADLIRVYLEVVERGGTADVEDLLARSGDHREELQEWIASHEAVRRMRATLSPGLQEPAGGVPAPFGDYAEFQWIGKGGMAAVFRARDRKLDRQVALKLLEAHKLPSPDAWLHEARALARLDHPNVVRIYEAGMHGEQPYLAMEFVEGWPLNEVLGVLAGNTQDAEPGLQVLAQRLQAYPARLDFAITLAQALSSCHDQGILHRDLKPRNVLVSSLGVPKLVDFGLAHHARKDHSADEVACDAGEVTSRLYGTPAYLAPEQMESGQTGGSVRTDLYAFGLLLYEIFGLQRPVRMAVTGPPGNSLGFAPPPPIPGVPRELNQLLARCLENRPADRYASMETVRQDLERIRANRPIQAVRPTMRRRLRLWARRQPVPAAVARITAVVLLAALAITWWSFHSDRATALEALDAAQAFQPGTLEVERFSNVFKKLSFPEGYAIKTAGGWKQVDRDMKVADRQGLQAEIDAVAASLDAIEAELAGMLDLDASPWRALYEEQPSARLLSHLDALALRVRELAAAEMASARQGEWTASILLPLVEQLARLESQLGGDSRLMPFLNLSGSVRFETARPGYEIRIQKWYRNEAAAADRLDPVSYLSPAYVLQDPYSGGRLLTPVAGRLDPERYYRITFVNPEDAADFHQINLRISLTAGRQLLQLAPRPFQDAVQVPGGSLGLRKPGNMVPTEFEVGGFVADRQPVTWRQFADYARGRAAEIPEYSLLEFFLDDETLADLPCTVPWPLAAGYARWRGARLPTMLEVVRMQESRPEAAQLPECDLREGTLSSPKGEWIEDADPNLRLENYFRLALAPGSSMTRPEWFHGRFYMLYSPTLASPNAVVFRCVRSLDAPSAGATEHP